MYIFSTISTIFIIWTLTRIVWKKKSYSDINKYNKLYHNTSQCSKIGKEYLYTRETLELKLQKKK